MIAAHAALWGTGARSNRAVAHATDGVYQRLGHRFRYGDPLLVVVCCKNVHFLTVDRDDAVRKLRAVLVVAKMGRVSRWTLVSEVGPEGPQFATPPECRDSPQAMLP